MLVQTAIGMIDDADMEIVDTIYMTDNARNIKTIWYYKGQMVREDGVAQILRTHAIGGEMAAVA